MTATDPADKTNLVSLPQPEGGEPGGASEGATSAGSRGAFWFLVVLLAVAVAGVAIQTRRVQDLLGQVDGLQAQLGRSEAAVQAYRGRFGLVRTKVSGLQSQVAELEALVSRDPVPAPER